MILECLEGMYVTYTFEIFSDPRRKKKVFVEQYLGLFLAELGLFCHFVPGLLAIALGFRLSLFIWIAGIGLGKRQPWMIRFKTRAKHFPVFPNSSTDDNLTNFRINKVL